MRRTEARTHPGIDSLISGIEGYRAFMKRYPVLSLEQTEAALFALRNKQSVNDLRSHALFAPSLEQEKRDLFRSPRGYHASPVRSYRQLFADSPTIGQLVSFGNFPTVLKWVEKFRATYKALPLDLEEFLQDAIYRLVPDEARRYEPMEGATFKSYLSNMLIWRLGNLVDVCITHRSTLPAGVQREGRRPKHDRRRLSIASLDAPLPQETDNGEVVSLSDIVEQTLTPAPGDSLERSEAIRELFTIAGITQNEAQVLQTDVIEGERQEYTAALYGVTTRTIRGRRDQAVAKFRRLGYETVIGILSGDIDAIPPQRR